MTIKDKAKKIKEFCDYRPNCFGCPLRPTLDEELCYTKEEFVGKHYDLLFSLKEENSEPQTKEAVNHPDHYQGKHECIDEMIALFGVEAVKHFCMCNVYKYRFRAARKNGEEDIRKAENYMDILMNLEAGNPWK